MGWGYRGVNFVSTMSVVSAIYRLFIGIVGCLSVASAVFYTPLYTGISRVSKLKNIYILADTIFGSMVPTYKKQKKQKKEK